MWCCSNKNHPDDIVCKYIYKRYTCDPDDPEENHRTPGGSTLGPSREMPSEQLSALENAINAYGDNPPSSLLITLAESLQKEGFNEDSLRVTRYLENVIPATEFVSLSRTYELQAVSLKELNQLEAAKNALEMSENLISMQVLRNRLNRALPKDIGRLSPHRASPDMG